MDYFSGSCAHQCRLNKLRIKNLSDSGLVLINSDNMEHSMRSFGANNWSYLVAFILNLIKKSLGESSLKATGAGQISFSP